MKRLFLPSLWIMSAFAAEAPAPKPAEDFQKLPAAVQAGQSTFLFKAQLLGELDRPVSGSIALTGAVINTSLDNKGRLLLEIGKTRHTLAATMAVPVTLRREDSKRSFTATLLFTPKPDKTWTYRNVTQLTLNLGKEQLVIVDANGNGAYNEPGKDGLAWAGCDFLFPLPADNEKWCTKTLELTGLALGPWGEDVKVAGRPLATVHSSALDVLKGVNDERVALGFTPRPEDPKLSSDLQKHCIYMKLNSKLSHPEEQGKPGYSEEGHKAGLRSILCEGWGAPRVASGMVDTLYHRYDVIRPNTVAFGVGDEGRYSGIDGRTNLFDAPAHYWPVMCPAPGQTKVRMRFRQEIPPPIPDPANAGFPISMYFGTDKLKLKAYSLKMLKGPRAGIPLECTPFDPQTGPNTDLIRGQKCCAIIPKEPLSGGMDYAVSMTIEVDGKDRLFEWRFSTE